MLFNNKNNPNDQTISQKIKQQEDEILIRDKQIIILNEKYKNIGIKIQIVVKIEEFCF